MRGRAYVKSTKLSSSPRLQHVGAHLLSAGLTVVPLAASIVASGLTSYLGGSLTQLRAWERILADRNLAVDGYSLIIEDDISRHPQLSADIVQPALLHAASLSNAAGLPFFYAGVCGIPYLMKRHSFVLHRGPTLPLDVPVRTNLTDNFQYGRVVGSCAHAYAVRRGAVPMLRNLGVACLSLCVAMDRMLTILSYILNGVYIAGLGLPSPAPWPLNEGIFFQDRARFASITEHKGDSNGASRAARKSNVSTAPSTAVTANRTSAIASPPEERCCYICVGSQLRAILNLSAISWDTVDREFDTLLTFHAIRRNLPETLVRDLEIHVQAAAAKLPLN